MNIPGSVEQAHLYNVLVMWSRKVEVDKIQRLIPNRDIFY